VVAIISKWIAHLQPEINTCNLKVIPREVTTGSDCCCSNTSITGTESFETHCRIMLEYRRLNAGLLHVSPGLDSRTYFMRSQNLLSYDQNLFTSSHLP